jgi:ubiquitin-conjugating enzyme E2 O
MPGISDLDFLRLGGRVELKNTLGLPSTWHGQESDPTGVLCVQIFQVQETKTTVDILWQDGSQETLKATDVIPYLNPDEYDCWCVLRYL